MIKYRMYALRYGFAATVLRAGIRKFRSVRATLRDGAHLPGLCGRCL